MKFLTAAGSGVGLLGWGGGSITGAAYSADPTLFGGLPPLGPSALTFSNIDRTYDFKGGVCVDAFLDKEEKELLKNAKTDTVREKFNDNWKENNGKFADPKGEAKGCAAVLWEQETWRNGLWMGVIRYEWLYKIGDETLITYALYNPMLRDSQGTFENGVIWRTLYLDKGRKISGGFIMHIDKARYLLLSPTGSPHWGFNLDLGTKGEKVCRDTIKCILGEGDGASRELKWTWEKDNSGNERFADWAKNFQSALTALMADPKINLNKFKDLMLERGTWTQR